MLQTESYPFSGSKVELGFFGALGFYRPQHTTSAVQVTAKTVMQWLASSDGPVWIEASTVDVQDIDRCVAIMYSPATLYGSDPDSVPKVGVGMVHKPAYVKTTAFDKALSTLFGLLNATPDQPDKRCHSEGVILLSVLPASSFIPHARPYPVLMDYVDENCLNRPTLLMTDYRAFSLGVIIRPGNKRSVYIPRCGEHPARIIDAFFEKRPDPPLEGVLVCNQGNWQGYVFRPSPPSLDHWTTVADGRYARFLSSVLQAKNTAEDFLATAQQIEAQKRASSAATGETSKGGLGPDLFLEDQPEGTIITLKTGNGASGTKIKGQQASVTSVSIKSAGDDPQTHVHSLTKRILTQQAQAFHELGRIRTVDRTTAEGLLSEQARLQSIVFEDAVCSLKRLVKETRVENQLFEADLKQALEPVPDRSLRERTMARAAKHSRNVMAAALLPVTLFDAAQKDIKAFLEARRDSLGAAQGTAVLTEACVERLSNLNDGLHAILQDPALDDPAVAGRVQLHLTATQPLVNNYFSGLLEGVLGLLGLNPKARGVVSEKVSDGLSQYYARTLKELLSTDSGGYQTDWEPDQVALAPGDMHLGYLADFSCRRVNLVHPVFDSTLMDDILGPLQELKLEDTVTLREPRAFSTQEELWDALQQAPPARQNYIQSLLLKTVMEESEKQEQPQAAPGNKTDPPQTGETGNDGDDGRRAEERVEPAGGSTVLRPTPGHQSGKVPKEVEKKEEGEGGGLDEGEKGEDEEADDDEDDEDDDDYQPPPAFQSKKRPSSSHSSHQHPPKRQRTSTSRTGEGLGPRLEAMTLKHEAGGGAQASVTFSMTGSSGHTLSQRELDSLGMLPPQEGSIVPILGSESTPQEKAGGGKTPTPSKTGKTPVSGKKHPASKVTPLPKTGGKTGATPEADVTILEEEAGEKDETPMDNRVDEEDEEGEEDDEDGDEEGEEDAAHADAVKDARFVAFCKDHEDAQKIRNELLGLDHLTRLTRKHLDESIRFIRIRVRVSGAKAEDVSRRWEALFLKQGDVLETCHPHQLEYAGNQQVVYLSKALIKLVPHMQGLWAKGVHRPHFLVVCHRDSTTKDLAHKGLGNTLFHRYEAIKRVTITTEARKEQITFCPYCGVCYGNITTAMSHLRKHLDFEFICGACLASAHKSIGTLSTHLLSCGARKTGKATRKSSRTNTNA